jgi:FtsZ-interacting cell division protein ZipA
MNWIVIIIVGIALVALIVFLVWRNVKDEKEFEKQQNNDYHKTKDAEEDIEIEEKLK